MSRYRICLSLYGNTGEVAGAIRENHADLYEIRMDLSSGIDPAKLRSVTKRPLIFTAHDRPDLLRSVVRYADFIDAGSASIQGSRHRKILSFHGDESYPSGLLSKAGPDCMVKIAINTDLYSTIFNLMLSNSENVLAFAMGEVASFSRVLSVFEGASWMYAALPGRKTAEGQFTSEELQNIYRLHRFSSRPAVFGIVGDPVVHSNSPRFHNARFAEKAKPWIYLPFLCKDLESLFEFAPSFGIYGFSITHPFKEKVMELLSDCDQRVKALGACNTVFCRNGTWEGTNTDVDGAQAVLKQLTELRPKSRVLILGAGGAAKAILFALKGKAKEATVLNRTPAKAAAVASQFGARSGSLTDFFSSDYDVLIQATSVGLRPHEIPVDPAFLKPGKTVIDLIYNPPETLLLKRARELRCKTINGIEWFSAQADAQYRWWEGREAPAKG